MESVWPSVIPDSLLFYIFTYLDVKELGRTASVCSRWHRVACDELLWQQLARRIWKIEGGLAPGKTSWYSEVKRLTYHVPVICSETIDTHTDEVLDVSISHSGRYFCTCSKDALIIMWEIGHSRNSRLVRSFDAGQVLKWQLSQYSVFCPDDSLVLVCGVKSYEDIPLDDIESEYKAGVGAVFTVPGMNVVSVVEMDPPTMFGAWLSERVFLGGWPGSRYQTVNIQAYEIQENQICNPIIDPDVAEGNPHHYLSYTANSRYDRSNHILFSFHGNRYHLMNLLVANVQECDKSVACDTRPGKCARKRTPQFDESFEVPETRKVKIVNSADEAVTMETNYNYSDSDACVKRSCDIPAAESSSYNGPDHFGFQRSENSSISLQTSETSGTSVTSGTSCTSCSTSENINKETEKVDNEDTSSLSTSHVYLHSDDQGASKTNVKCESKQYVAFVTGNHDVIAVHEVKPQHLTGLFEGKVKEGTENDSMDSARPGIDQIDHNFHIKDCYITGLCLARDQRFLYFNYRDMDKKDPQNQVDDSDDDLPVADKVFCKDLKIGCIDFVTMEMVRDFELLGHVGYSSFPAWYICLDASPDYIGSGSEDMRGYIWDRHYGVRVGRLFHSSLDTGDNTLLVLSFQESSVVNGFAFSPIDQEMCITVCDDRLIKVWRSRHCMNLFLETERNLRGYRGLKKKLGLLKSTLKPVYDGQS